MPFHPSSVIDWWSAYYGNHEALSVTIRSLHLLGLAVGGGAAVAADLRVLQASRGHLPALAAVADMDASHRLVISSLVVIVATGVLMATSDVETYRASILFWTKMALLGALIANGAVLAMAARRAHVAGASVPKRLAVGAALSITLWLAIVYVSSWLVVAA